MKSTVLVLCFILTIASIQAFALHPVRELKHYPEGRIINGHPALPKQFPWQAAVTINMAAFCGGSLIHPEWILTAAHCVQGSLFQIAVGSNKRTEFDINRQVMVSRDAVFHEEYDPVTLHNDIGLIKLPEPVELNEYTQIVPLDSPSNYVQPDTDTSVSGWGQTESGSISENLNYASLKSISNSVCAEKWIGQNEKIYNSTICCQGLNNESTCFGDSGGPLVQYDKHGENVKQVGIVSFVSNRGCLNGEPTGYVRTASYRDWIKEKTGGAV